MYVLLQEVHEAGLEGILGTGQAGQKEREALAAMYNGFAVMANMAKDPEAAWDLVLPSPSTTGIWITSHCYHISHCLF